MEDFLFFRLDSLDVLIEDLVLKGEDGLCYCLEQRSYPRSLLAVGTRESWETEGSLER